MSSPSSSSPLACRLGGCRWRYRSDGALLVQECARRCGRSATHRFRRSGDATRLAAYLRRGRSSLLATALAPGRWLLDGGR